MAKVKLRWEADTKRAGGGRWTKEYRKRKFYFSDINGKSDRAGEARALEAFLQWRAEIDAQAATEAPQKRYADRYEKAIATKQAMLDWLNLEANHEPAPAPVPVPVKVLIDGQQVEERPRGQHEPEEDHEALAADLQAEIADLQAELAKAKPAPLQPKQAYALLRFDSRLQGVWRKRLEQVKGYKRFTSAGANQDTSVANQVEQFFAIERNRVEIGEIKATSYKAVLDRLVHFKNFAGDIDASKISEITIDQYKSWIIGQIKDGKLSVQYANHIAKNTKRFINWLWERRILDNLPRNLKTLAFTVPPKKIKTFDKPTLKLLIKEASERTKLYLLLMLNCGFLPMDISELAQSEFDEKAKRITRKRGKTKHRSDEVPEVSWRLWDETAALLVKHKSQDKNLVLTNDNGSALIRKELLDNGRVGNVNNIRKAYERICKKCKLSPAPQLMLIRKTGATELEKHESYGRFAQYFLGQAPQSLAEARYAKPSEKQFDLAVKWLGEQFGYNTTN